MSESDLLLYNVTVGPHVTPMRLNARDAAAYGVNAVLADEQLREPLAVAAVLVTDGPAEPDPEPKSRLVTSNKMRGVEAPATRSVLGKPEGAK